MQTLSSQNLTDILNGAVILSCGGGGPYALGQQLINYIESTGKSPVLAQATEFSGDALGMVSISVGPADAPLGDDPVEAALEGLRAMEQALGKSISFIIPGETGAVNTFYALALGVAANLPVVDADSGRRSIPALSMSTFASLSPNPMILTGNNNIMTVEVQNTLQGDDAIRGLESTNLFGEDATVSLWNMSTITLQSFGVLGSVSYALGLGEALRTSVSSGKTPVQAVTEYMNGKVIFEGIITASTESVSGGFDIGYICIEWTMGRRVWVYNQNENLIAWYIKSSQPLGIGPDLLCYLTEDGIPFTNGDLYRADGKKVALIGASCVPKLRSQAYIGWQQTLMSIGYAGALTPIWELSNPTGTELTEEETSPAVQRFLQRGETAPHNRRRGTRGKSAK